MTRDRAGNESHLGAGVRAGIVVENYFPSLGGMEFATYHLVNALNTLPNTEASVACSTMPKIPRRFPYGHNVFRARSFGHLTPWFYRQNLAGMIRKRNINILHGMMLHGGGRSATVMARRFHLPVVVHSRGSDVQVVPEIGYGARLDPDVDRVVKKTLEAADKVLAVSTINRDMILELGVPEEKIVVLHNGVLYDEIEAVPYQEMRASLGLSPDDFVLITVSRNRPIKRMELLFQALRLLGRSNKDIKCICVGPEESLPELVVSYGLQGIVILTGRIPAENGEPGAIRPPYPLIVNLYRAADLFVSVSYMEAFQGGAADALACGIPVLLGRKHGVRDVIIEGETGFTMEKETPEDLADLILELYRRRTEFKAGRGRIRQSVKHLAWEKVAARLRDIYAPML